MKKHLKKWFISGLLVVIPTSLTVYVLLLIINFTDRLYPAVREYLPVYVPGFGIILTFLCILLTGIITTNFLGRRLIAFGERIIAQIPFVKELYHSSKQIATAVFSSSHRTLRRVVLIEYPRRDLYTLAFVTGAAQADLNARVGTPMLNLFVPTTPNPTSGFFLMVPADDVIEVDMSPEDAFKLIVSGGIASRQEP